MALPTPNPNEERSDFISRCMSNDQAEADFPDNKQRVAVCNSQFRKARGIKEDEELSGHKDKKKKLKHEIASIENMEIARAGKFKNNTINLTEKDLDEMVNNFKQGILEPFANLDHDDKFTDKIKKQLKVVNLGLVSDLKRVGASLIASFKQVPKKIAEMIRSGRLKFRSIEFFPKGFRQGEKVFNNVLRAVSFFGADVPAINSLADDFEIFLKSDHVALHDNQDCEVIKILKKERNMMEISDKEYQDLVSLKAKVGSIEKTEKESSNKLETLKSDNQKLSDEKKKIEGDNKKLHTFKESAEKEKEETLKKEGESFINKIIGDGKLPSKYKETYIEDYLSKATDPEKLKLFKEDCESRDKIMNLGELEGGSKANFKYGEIPLTNEAMDEASEAIENLIEKDNIDYEKAFHKITKFKLDLGIAPYVEGVGR